MFNENRYTKDKQRYIKDMHDSFVSYVSDLLVFLKTLMVTFPVTEDDKKIANMIVAYLTGAEYHAIEKILTKEDIDVKILDRVAEFYKHLVDLVVDHVHKSEMVKEILKRLAHSQIDRNKSFAEERIKGIKVVTR